MVFDDHIPGVSKEDSPEMGLKMKARTDAPAKMTSRRYRALTRIGHIVTFSGFDKGSKRPFPTIFLSKKQKLYRIY